MGGYQFHRHNYCESALSIVFIALSLSCTEPLGPFSSVNAQPLLNSLALFFRSRPPWPTSFPHTNIPASSNIPFFPNSLSQNPGPLIASGATQQGILVAHPISTNNNFHKPHFQLPSNQIFSPSNAIPLHHNNVQNVIPNSNVFKPPGGGGVRFPLEMPTNPPFHNVGIIEENVLSGSNLQTSNSKAQVGQAQKLDFRPSPQLMVHDPFQFVGTNTIDNFKSDDHNNAFVGSEAQIHPNYESGFQPIGHNQYGSQFGTEHYTNGHQQYNPWGSASAKFTTASPLKRNSTKAKPKANLSKPFREDRQIVNAVVSKSVVTTEVSVEQHPRPKESKRSKEKMTKDNPSSTTSSSELVEDWVKVKDSQSFAQASSSSQRFPVYKSKLGFIRPAKCEFHRYGFCGTGSHYPKADVEKVASRCYALLTHIISPPVAYNIAVSHNGTIRERFPPGKRQNQRGWSWKSYHGKPLCDTLELKVSPGWAKDEQGDWVVVLQTPQWKQEAQVSICASSQTQCIGFPCSQRQSTDFQSTKCVQRFTAQRMAVLDSTNQENCPVIKSVFLPSACICINDIVNSSSFDQNTSESRQVPTATAIPLNDTTFMIVTEKFSINESSSDAPG